MLIAWLRRLKQSFGLPFILLVVSIYWTQGFRAFPWTGISYLIKDELKLSPAASQLLTSTAFIPWSIKPIYGIFSDTVYIYGDRRVPYLIISSILSTLAWGTMALFRSVLLSSVSFTALLTCQNIGSALADVVVDAMVAETTKQEREEFAGDLQTLSWLAMALGGVLGSLLGGPGLKLLRPSGMFLVFTMFPIIQCISCSLISEKRLLRGGAGMAIEERETRQEDDMPYKLGKVVDEDGEGKERELAERNGPGDEEPEKLVSADGPLMKNGSNDKLHSVHNSTQVEVANRNVKMGEETDMGGRNGKGKSQQMGLLGRGSQGGQVNGFAHGQHQGEDLNGSHLERSTIVEKDLLEKVGDSEGGGLGTEVGVAMENSDGRHVMEKRKLWKEMKQISFTLWQAMRQPSIMRPLLWFFMSLATVPSLQTMMFYYQTNFLQLDPEFLGTSRVVGWAGLMAGTLVYNSYLKRVPLRTVFLWVHILLATCTFSDTLLVLRINIFFGLPDKLWVLGASAFTDAINQFKFMPFLILSARLCPPGIEGTLFAVFMSAYNLGGTISGYFGATLASYLNISATSFDQLAFGLSIQALCTLLPVPLLFMIPKDVAGTSDQNQVKVLIDGGHEKQT